jgi:hypothetical protein
MLVHYVSKPSNRTVASELSCRHSTLFPNSRSAFDVPKFVRMNLLVGNGSPLITLYFH